MFAPIIQVQIRDDKGKEVLTTGYLADIPLLDCSWSLEVDSNASQCQFSIPLIKEILDRLMDVKPFEPPTSQPKNNISSIGLSASTEQGTNKESHIRIIVEEAKRQGITNKYQLAYILATVDHETSWSNFEELSSGSQYEGRSDLGNTQPGDGVRYKGRGYVQLTGRANYTKYSQLTSKDLVGNPALAKQNPIMAFVLVHGMRTGGFTGAKLSDYTQRGGGVDYYSARAIVNGDKAINGASIAAKAKAYENHPLLQNLTNTNPADKEVSVNPTVANSESGAHKIYIRVGEMNALFAEYIYLISDIKISHGSNPQINISGITPLWSINQYKQTETLSNLTLKQLAERTAKKANLSLEFSGVGTEIVHLENNGLTDYQLLLRECKKAGYVISHVGTKMVIQPIRRGKQYLLDLKEIISFSSSIKPSSPLPQSSGGIAGTWTAKPTIKSDNQTGSISSSSTSANKPNRPQSGTESKTKGTVTDSQGKQVTESQAQSELARVQDNPSSIQFIPQLSDLLIRPTDMIKIEGLKTISDKLAKLDFWVSSVSFQFDNSGLIMELGMYQPGREVKVNQELAGNSITGNPLSDSLPGNTPGFANPMKNGKLTGAGNGFRTANRPSHGGLDLFGDTNQIFASADGVVVDAENSCVEGDRSCAGRFGNLVYINHADGYQTRYAHMVQGSVVVKIGQQVKQGQYLGQMGNTGDSYGAHLHFEIVRNGARLNPANLITPRP